MSSILVLYHSYDEQAARIAKRMGKVLLRAGHSATVERFDGKDVRNLSTYGAVIVGAAVRYGHHDHRLERALKRRLGELTSRPNAFFSVCLAATRNAAEAQGYVDGFCRRTGWEPGEIATFAGALRYTRYGWFRKAMMRAISKMAGGETDTSRDYEYTDWDAVERFASNFVSRLGPDPRFRVAA